LSERVVERDFFVVEPEIDAALVLLAQLLRELDQLFKYFPRSNRAVVIRIQCFLDHVRELSALDEVAVGANANFVAQKFLEKLNSYVLVFESADLGEELVGKLLMSDCFRPAAWKTSMISPSGAIAFASSCRTA
jgi:hypothetical protein